MRAEIFLVASQILTAKFASTMQYSQDLKNAAVRLAMDGKTYTQASKELRISPQSVRNWHTRFLAVEHCKNKKQPGAKPRVTEEAFTAFHKAYPNAMQKDAAAYFEIRACYHYLFV